MRGEGGREGDTLHSSNRDMLHAAEEHSSNRDMLQIHLKSYLSSVWSLPVQSAVLGACLCRAEREPCPCARTAKKHLLQLTQEVCNLALS